jgi:hypothetical protein
MYELHTETLQQMVMFQFIQDNNQTLMALHLIYMQIIVKTNCQAALLDTLRSQIMNKFRSKMK